MKFEWIQNGEVLKTIVFNYSFLTLNVICKFICLFVFYCLLLYNWTFQWWFIDKFCGGFMKLLTKTQRKNVFVLCRSQVSVGFLYQPIFSTPYHHTLMKHINIPNYFFNYKNIFHIKTSLHCYKFRFCTYFKRLTITFQSCENKMCTKQNKKSLSKKFIKSLKF